MPVKIVSEKDIPMGYSGCGLFWSKEKAEKFAEAYAVEKKCPVLIGHTTKESPYPYTVWKKTNKNAKMWGSEEREYKKLESKKKRRKY
jgi:hypothetical protein